MIRRITLENYMSHARTVIEPADGLTVLVGPNNCGKSAVVSALQTLCGENAGEFMVRHGEKLCRVTVETDDDDDGCGIGLPPDASSHRPEGRCHAITWQRKGSAVSYTIDGREIHRAGRGNLPDDLHELLKMPTIESIDGKKQPFNVHFALQKEPIFLIGRERDTAEFFSSSSDAERLLEMQRRHKQKVTASRQEHRTCETDVKRLDEQLAALIPLEQLGPDVEQVEAEHRSLLAEADAIARLQRRIEQIDLVARREARLAAVAAALAPLRAPPAMEDERPLAQLVERMQQSGAAAERQRLRAAAMADLQPPPAIQDVAALNIVCNRLDDLARQAAREQARAAALAPLMEPPAPADLKPLGDLGRRLKSAIRVVEATRALAAAMAELREPPVLCDPSALEKAATTLERAALREMSAGDALVAVDRAVTEVERRIIRFVTTHPICPTCGSVMDAEHLINHGGPTHGSE